MRVRVAKNCRECQNFDKGEIFWQLLTMHMSAKFYDKGIENQFLLDDILSLLC